MCWRGFGKFFLNRVSDGLGFVVIQDEGFRVEGVGLSEGISRVLDVLAGLFGNLHPAVD